VIKNLSLYEFASLGKTAYSEFFEGIDMKVNYTDDQWNQIYKMITSAQTN